LAAREYIVQFTLENDEPVADDLKLLKKIGKSLNRAAFRSGGGELVKYTAAKETMNIVMRFCSYSHGRSFFNNYIHQQNWSDLATVFEKVSGSRFRKLWPDMESEEILLEEDYYDLFQEQENGLYDHQNPASVQTVSRNPKKRRRAEINRARLDEDASCLLARPGEYDTLRLRRPYRQPDYLRKFNSNDMASELTVDTGEIVVVDPFVLAKISSSRSKSANFIRAKALISDYIRAPIAIPILEYQNSIVLPTSAHFENKDNITVSDEVKIRWQPLISLSGTFAFFEYSDELPDYIQRKLEEAKEEGLASILTVSDHAYELYYEKFESYKSPYSVNRNAYHNIVLKPANR